MKWPFRMSAWGPNMNPRRCMGGWPEWASDGRGLRGQTRGHLLVRLPQATNPDTQAGSMPAPAKATETNAARTCGSPQSRFSLWQWTCPEWPSPPPRGLRAAPSKAAAPTPRTSTPEAVLSATPSSLPAGGHGRASRASGASPCVWFPQAPPSPQATSCSVSERRHAPPAAIKRGSSRGLEAPLASLDQCLLPPAPRPAVDLGFGGPQWLGPRAGHREAPVQSGMGVSRS